MKHICAGIDVSKDKFDCAVRDWKNRLVFGPKEYITNLDGLKEMKQDLDRVSKELKADLLLGCESTGIYHLPIVQFCDENKLSIMVFNAIELKKYHQSNVRKNRNDQIDASTIAKALVIEGDFPDDFEIPSEIKTLRELTRIRHRLIKDISLCKVRVTRNMDVICRGYTNFFKDILGPTSTAILKECAQLTRPFNRTVSELSEILKIGRYTKQELEEKTGELAGIFSKAVIPDGLLEPCIIEIKQQIQHHELLEEHLSSIDQRIDKIVESMDSPIMSIDGIGKVNAGIILGEIGSIDRFSDVKALVAYAGLDATRRSSGRFESETCHISKRGSPYLRGALYMSAISARRVNPVCRVFADRLDAKGKKSKVMLIAVARKLLTIIYSVLKNNREFRVSEQVMAALVS